MQLRNGHRWVVVGVISLRGRRRRYIILRDENTRNRSIGQRDLQAVNLLQRDSTNLRVVLVTVVKVVKVLRGDHHAM